MKTFTEILKEDRSTATLVRRRDARNNAGQLTKAQRLIQDDCCYALARHVAYLEACSQLVTSGELHPLEHPLASYYAERRREALLHTPHPVTIAHPLAQG